MSAMKGAILRNMKAIDQSVLNIPGSFSAMTNDAIAGGMAFLIGQLEKQDVKLREPLASVTWMRDIVAKSGGGWVDYTSNYFVNYATTGGGQNSIIGGETNNIPTMQADIEKTPYKVFTWAHILKVPFVDQQKLQSIGRSLEEILDKGIKLNYQKTVDLLVYSGFSNYGVTGIVNDPNVTAYAVAKGVSTKTTWKDKTPDEILYDVNTIILLGWEAAEYDLSGMPNHILIPPEQFAYICNQKVSTAGNVSILTYLMENNIAKNQGIDLVIAPSRWCKGAGTAGADRMLAYVNDEDKLNFDLTVPISRVMTQPVVTELAYLTAYAAQMGQVKFLYYQPPHYGDGI